MENPAHDFGVKWAFLMKHPNRKESLYLAQVDKGFYLVKPMFPDVFLSTLEEHLSLTD